MKKHVSVILLGLYTITIIFSVVSLPSGFFVGQYKASLRLPESLIKIEDEAFKNTAAVTVVFSNTLAEIGERAFADVSHLKTVVMLSPIKYIGDHAFEGSENFAIFGFYNSYVVQWAKKHNIAFVKMEDIVILREKISKNIMAVIYLSLFFTLCSRNTLNKLRHTADITKSMRPQDRTELYPINYRFP